MDAKGITEIVGRLVPRATLDRLGGMLEKAGVDMEPHVFSGFVIIACCGLAMAGMAMGLQTELGISLVLLCALASFLFLPVVAYAMLMLRVEARKNRVEEVLPDFLQLAAANVRAGMPIDQAMWHAARPEFGMLSNEIEVVAKRTFGGEPFAKTLDELASRFESRILKRSVSLIKQGLQSGGEMAEILENTAADVRNIQLLRKEIRAGLLMYVIFIVFASVLGAPFMYAVSYKLVSVLEGIWAQMPNVEAMKGKTLVVPTSPGIGADQFLVFAVVSVAITSVIASFIIATIQTGSKKNGVRYAPIFFVVSLLVFITAILVLNMFFAGMG
ncbi:MAG: type II secretion system F family protein [Candidatus Micrarchaeota archaeon]|nr:type II secretion system F family protein [Candidatus Micrarchaeota archaeon]